MTIVILTRAVPSSYLETPDSDRVLPPAVRRHERPAGEAIGFVISGSGGEQGRPGAAW